jgi:hypothetical protein
VSYALNFSSWVITFRKMRKKKKKEEKDALGGVPYTFFNDSASA